MDELKKKVNRLTKDLGMDLCGVADAEVVNEKAPPGFSPEDQLPDAKSVVIFAQRLPSGSFFATPGTLRENYYMRSFWTNFHLMNSTSYQLARLLEEESGYPSLQIPANEPLRIHDGKPRGMVSLKHIGQLAGIGSIAMNSLLVNPEHGNLLRLGGVITQAPLTPDTPLTEDPCPDGCETCIKACPVGAIKDHSVDIKSCMKLSLRHPLLQPYIFSKFLFSLSTRSTAVHRMVEDIANMLVMQYSESCTKCLVACRHFKTAIKRAQKMKKKDASHD